MTVISRVIVAYYLKSISYNFFFNVDVVIDEELFDETDLADIEAEINELELEA